MNFIAGKDEADKEQGEKSALDKIKDSGGQVIKCRICKEDHWTTNCPYKDTLGPLRDSLAGILDLVQGRLLSLFLVCLVFARDEVHVDFLCDDGGLWVGPRPVVPGHAELRQGLPGGDLLGHQLLLHLVRPDNLDPFLRLIVRRELCSYFVVADPLLGWAGDWF